ncbi:MULTISPECIES: MFS transporter [unclassified Curtobacterium]|uniref:MFS transporter n=1 Tax=unclassified Curtobacterium TaxID=257496 RepID=UPI000D931E9E|nr:MULTISPECIES: MFS transporter [unclassified Curtobacterium]PYY55869.1 MFS transporter [Curtobacterium sp. MCSS17_011]WIE79197.1 MFS transporter [Curtobacterium sp. MCSS17_016]
METIAQGATPNERESIRAAAQRRTLIAVIATQVLGGAGLAAGVTVGALLAEDMLGSDAVAGLPAAVLTFGSAVTAFVVGRASNRYGRRPGLSAGFLAGGVGSIGVVLAARIDSPALLFAALLVYGAGTATNLQARYAGTDLAPKHRRATAASVAMVSTTLGAVVGPNLVEPMGRLAISWNVPALAGPFILAAAAYLAAGTVLHLLLRPDPLLLARQLDVTDPATVRDATTPAVRRVSRGVVAGALTMVVAQIVMTGIMTMTPVHMQMHHHALSAVGVVIGVHITAMYLPSLVAGALVDRVGTTVIAVASGTALLLAGVSAATLGDSVAASLTALILLGLGWNFGIIAGTAMIVDATEPGECARVQGSVDVLIALAGASGGALSGVVMAATTYSNLAFAGAVLALLSLPAIGILRRPLGTRSPSLPSR